MVPDRINFQADFHLDFLSKYIAEEVVAKVETDSLETVSAFAISDDSGSTAVLRGRIYEMLCHRRFRQSQALFLNYRSLNSVADMFTLDIPAELKVVRFRTLEELPKDKFRCPKEDKSNCLTYYQPTSRMFGALNVFIVDSKNSKCYGLQMTLNENYGIKAAPMKKFLDWLKSISAKVSFEYVFMVPSNIESKYQKQTLRNKR